MTKSRIYISGPMKGYDDLNFPAFQRAYDALCADGDCDYDVISPHMIVIDPHAYATPDLFYDACLREDIAALMSCSALCTLENWEASRGARLEVSIAIQVGIYVHSIKDIIGYYP